QTSELRKRGLRIRLEGQPAAILAMLLDRPNQLVTREELQKKLWSADTFVDFEQSLNAAIRRLRLALDDSAESPRYIETLARKGYRWVAPLETPAPAVALEARPTEATDRERPGRRAARIAVGTTLGVALLFIAWGVLRPRPAGDRVMLAVLPFENLSGDPQQEYLADGMTDEMITQLGGLNPQQLSVIARTSAMRYKAGHQDTSQIARELHGNYLLEGSVRRQEHRIRVTARLIQASNQAEVWADSYDAEVSDILKVQSEVARAIASQIRMQLPRQARQRLSGTPRVNGLAHDAY